MVTLLDSLLQKIKDLKDENFVLRDEIKGLKKGGGLVCEKPKKKKKSSGDKTPSLF